MGTLRGPARRTPWTRRTGRGAREHSVSGLSALYADRVATRHCFGDFGVHETHSTYLARVFARGDDAQRGPRVAGGRSSPEAPCPAPLRAPRPAQLPSGASRAGRASTEPSGATRRIRVLVPCGSCTCLTSRSVSARRQQWSCRERRLHLYYFWEIGSALRIRVGSLQKGPRALPGGPSCGLGRLQQCPRSEGQGLGPPEPGDSQHGAAAVGAHTTRGALDAVGSGCWLPPGTQPEAPGGLSLRGHTRF